MARIEQIATETVVKAEIELGVSLRQLGKQDLDPFEELVEYELRQREEFHRLVDEILDAVDERFEALAPEGFRRNRNDWPLLWQFETKDRAEFIRTVNQFSSNYAPNFGKLLLHWCREFECGGPFKPEWLPGSECKLVLMDGEGLGHTPDSSASISTKITQRLNDVDAVVLVNSAEQPMQAGPQALPAERDRERARSAGRGAEVVLSRAVSVRVFFVSNIQEPIKESARMTVSELQQLVRTIGEAIVTPPSATVTPVYDVANLILCIPQAIAAFRDPWRARLRLPSGANVSPVHWARIKALSRRFAELGDVEYDTLRPVADFILLLNQSITTQFTWRTTHGSSTPSKSLAMSLFAQPKYMTGQRIRLH